MTPRRIVVGVVAAFVAAAGAYLLHVSREAAKPASTTAASSTPTLESAPVSPSAVAPAPSPSGTTAATVAVRAPAPKATLHNDFLQAKSLRPLYDRLQGTPEGATPEGTYILYEILRRCAEVTERDWKRPLNRPPPAKRDEFLASLAPADPQRERRIAAYEEVTTNRCAGMEGVGATQADLSRMLADAAAGGDPKARAHSMELDLWAARRGDRKTSLTDEQFADLKQIAQTKDPEALLIAGRLMSNSWHEYALRLSPDGPNVDPRAFHNAFTVLACDYGAACGENNVRILSACAHQGHCDAGNLTDYLTYYTASPHDSELLNQYRGLIRNAVESGDWSRLNIVRGPLAPGAPRVFYTPMPR